MNVKIAPIPDGSHLLGKECILSKRVCDGVKLMVLEGDGHDYVVTLQQLKEGLASHLGVSLEDVDSYIKTEE